MMRLTMVTRLLLNANIHNMYVCIQLQAGYHRLGTVILLCWTFGDCLEFVK